METDSTSCVVGLSHEACMRVYAPFYCEENVWRILRLAAAAGHDTRTLTAIFISNPARRIPVWRQRAGKPLLDGLCVWDYHVILAVGLKPGDARGALIYDIDSELPFPTDAKEYVRQALWHCANGNSGWDGVYRIVDRGHQFRCVSYDEMMEGFASDRRHMRKKNGEGFVVPPKGDCIRGSNAGGPHTLPLFLKMSREEDDDPFSTKGKKLGELPGVLFKSAYGLFMENEN